MLTSAVSTTTHLKHGIDVSNEEDVYSNGNNTKNRSSGEAGRENFTNAADDSEEKYKEKPETVSAQLQREEASSAQTWKGKMDSDDYTSDGSAGPNISMTA